MTLNQIERQLFALRNKRARATQKPDPYGLIIGGFNRQIAELEQKRLEVQSRRSAT